MCCRERGAEVWCSAVQREEGSAGGTRTWSWAGWLAQGQRQGTAEQETGQGNPEAVMTLTAARLKCFLLPLQHQRSPP